MSEQIPSRTTSLLQVGGGLGISACLIGVAIFLVACFGFNAVFILSMLPLVLGGFGIVLSIAGPVTQKAVHVEDTAVFAAIFLNVLGIVGGLLLMSAWLGWQIFPLK